MLMKIYLLIVLFTLTFAAKHSSLFSARSSEKYKGRPSIEEIEEANLRDKALLEKIIRLIKKPNLSSKEIEQSETDKGIEPRAPLREEIKKEEGDDKEIQPRQEDKENKVIQPRQEDEDDVKEIQPLQVNKEIQARHKERESIRKNDEEIKIIEPRHRKDMESERLVDKLEHGREEDKENRVIQPRHKMHVKIKKEHKKNKVIEPRHEELKEEKSNEKYEDTYYKDKRRTLAKHINKKFNNFELDETKKDEINWLDNLTKKLADNFEQKLAADQAKNSKKKSFKKIESDEAYNKALADGQKKDQRAFENALNEKKDDNKEDNNDDEFDDEADETEFNNDDDEDDDKDDENDDEDDEEPNLVYIESHDEDEDDEYDVEKNSQENDRSSERMMDKQAVDPCGVSAPLVFQAIATVKSPGYATSTYPKSAKCSWKIVAPAGKVVKLKIAEMAMEDSALCQYDSLIIFDVKDGSGLKMGRYCGKTIPPELLKSSQNIMFVYYVSDNVDNAGKFSFTWTFENAQGPAPSISICGIPKFKPKGSEKIVNGEQATPHSWPWQISLRLLINGKQYHICGGTIVSQNTVLTAAHCAYNEAHQKRPFSDFAIVAGDHDQTTTSDGQTQSPSVKRLTVHEQYNPYSASSPYDIAIFEVNGGFTFNDNVKPVCLPTETAGSNDKCYATGWGDTKGTAKQTLLNHVLLPIVQNSVCSQSDHYGGVVKSSMLCAGYEEGGKDACQGDSGGPLVCERYKRWYLQGITSFGDGCALPRKPGIYTRVTDYLDWIKAKSGVVP